MHTRPHASALPRWVDPEAAFALLAADGEDLFWLDAGTEAASGWSMLGIGTPATVAEVGAVVVGADDAREPWTAGPFRGGFVGWLDYETGAALAGAPTREHDQPSRWLRVRRFLSFDHTARSVWLVADPADAEASAWAHRLLCAPAVDVPSLAVTETATVPVTPEAHAERVAQCREHIRVGDVYQLCLTTQFTVPGRHDPVAVALRLRAQTRAHHGGAVRIGSTSLVSGSPEQFLTVTGGTVQTKPIKGTRPRGADAHSDETLIEELRTSVKERAENVMIVDLMRNDLSRVCEPGSVRVEGLWEVETYPTVHQLVSTVAGEVRPGVRAAELWAAAFPAGSMTGAPKLRAMELLHHLEQTPRGIYAGCFGWVGLNGDLDLAMVIRTIVIGPDAASVGSGGGITWGSVPEEEVAEVGVKVRAPLAALGARAPQGW